MRYYKPVRQGTKTFGNIAALVVTILPDDI